MNTFSRLVAVVALLLGLALSGCGFIDYYFLPPAEDTAQELYELGVEAMAAKEYDDAAEAFQKLKDRFPFSPYAAKAEIGLGDAYYLGEEYALASDTYQEFEALHPRHEMIEYVLYQIGMSNYLSFSSIDKPLGRIDTAAEYFKRLIEAFPDSKYAPEAERYIVECRRKLAEHEIFVADFYWRSERYGAAWERYRYVAVNYADLPEVVAYAEKRAQLAYLRHQETLSDDERERIQGSWKQWFDWL